MRLPSRARRLAPPSTGAEPQAVPIAFEKGMFAVGDPSTIPDGYVVLLENMTVRPGPLLVTRPPTVYDNLMNINGLGLWDDVANNVRRMMAVDTSKALYAKGTSGETWSASLNSDAALEICNFAQFLGKVWLSAGKFTDLGLTTLYNVDTPHGLTTYDGTTVNIAPLINPVVALVVAFKSRLFFVNVTAVVASIGTNAITDAYDWSAWTQTNVNVRILTLATGVTVCRVSPTSLTASACKIETATFTVTTSTSNTPYVWRAEFHGVDATKDVPVTIELYLQGPSIGRLTAYNANDLLVTGGYRYRCSTAGTTAAGAPAFNTGPGTQTVDGTATWTNEGTEVLAFSEDTVYNATDFPDFVPYNLPVNIPAATNTLTIGSRLKLYNSAQTALTSLTPIDISARDGKADADTSKSCHGHQWTRGPLFVPFFNQQVIAVAPRYLADIMWTEINNQTVLNASSFNLKDGIGKPTAVVIASGRMVIFQRNAFHVMAPQPSADNPILPETPGRAVGCLAPGAVDLLDDEIFWVGEDECYRMRVGGDPVPICGDGMRSQVMARAGRWCEAQSPHSAPRLAINPKEREVWVYTQKGYLYCYRIDKAAWSRHTLPVDTTVKAMLWNPNTRLLYAALSGYGLVKLDSSAVANDTYDSTLTSVSVTKKILCKPFELSLPPRAELCLHEVAAYHRASAAQTNEYAECKYSFDQGGTFPKNVQVRPDLTEPRVPFDAFQFGRSVMPLFQHVGQAGETIWSVSRLEGMVELLAGEWPWTQPTQIGGTL